MDVKELRIGNFVVYDGLVHKLESILGSTNSVLLHTLDGEVLLKVHINLVSAIELDMGSMLDCGFEKINHKDGYVFYTKDRIDVYVEGRTKYCGFNVNKCKFIHQLQNLYFAITGNELYFNNYKSEQNDK